MDTAQAYQILQIKQNSSFSEVKYAYRKLALELHPDKNDKEQDGAKFKMITEAYHVLKKNSRVANSKTHTAKYTDSSKNERTVSRTSWGATAGDKIPEEDWSKYTRHVEDADPMFWQKYVSDFWKSYEERMRHPSGVYDFEITQEKEPDILVDVDHSLCIGCCSCEIIAPSVFSVDKISKMNPKSTVINRKGAKCSKIMDAAQTCPTKAIKVDEEQTGARLYPY